MTKILLETVNLKKTYNHKNGTIDLFDNVNIKIKSGDYQLRYFMGVSNYPLTSHAPEKGLQLKIHDSVDGLELTTFSTRGGKVLFPVKWGIDYKEL